MADWPLEKGQYTVESVASGWNYSVRTLDGLIFRGWAATEDDAEERAQELLDDG